MRIDFHFDPTCPWCWVTSRWLVDVSQRRDLEITWRPFSLGIKTEDQETPERFRRSQQLGLEALRLALVVGDRHGNEAVGGLYTELGRRIHHDRIRDVDFADVLDAVGLEADLAAAASEEALDVRIRESMAAVLELTGDDVGIPIVEMDGTDGPVAVYGPVVSPPPSGAEADVLFDQVVALARMPGFFELKRSRSGPVELGPRP